MGEINYSSSNQLVHRKYSSWDTMIEDWLLYVHVLL